MSLEKEFEEPILILGGGITGLTVGYQLVVAGVKNVCIVEKSSVSGGLASTCSQNGIQFDLGSHRIHPGYYPEALSFIESLIPGQLLKRPRHGRVLLGGVFTKYPPSLTSILQSVGLLKAVPIILDYLVAQLFSIAGRNAPKNFETALSSKLGKRLFNLVFAPYARKLWGENPDKIASDAADHRISSFSLTGAAKRLFSSKAPKHFLYPKNGIGSISAALADAFQRRGGTLLLNSSVSSAHISGGVIKKLVIEREERRLEIDNPSRVISTIPLDKIFEIARPDHAFSGSFPMKWRGIRLANLVVRDPDLDPSETFYIPDSKYLVGRISEVRKYSPQMNSSDGDRVFSCEVPAGHEDFAWSQSEEEFIELVFRELKELTILSSDAKLDRAGSFSIKIPYVYPVYDMMWRENLDTVLGELDKVANLISTGRSGLFLHCNIDHCIKMGIDTAEVVMNDSIDWKASRASFFDYHVRP